jgi:putative heme iron utilization protein
MEDARQQLAQMLELQPDLTLDSAAAQLSMFFPFQPELVRKLVDGLASVGLQAADVPV